ncbi:MAG: wax ester/triacylglycerol synthase family O-acyltransferase [Myxococcales bacterium]|nr:wax ester/triacylglycerol synthase family O-acyltransferase [Myxococcales bacterium]
MTMGHFERMTAGDATFLAVETPRAHMHVGAVAIFDGAPLTEPDGRLQFERVRDHLLGALAAFPRYRQRVVATPLLGQPVWVDDDHFDVAYHLRHTRLPLPGDERQLKRLAGRILSQRLDRAHPLWELWLVEGLDDGRIAIIAKVHHCLLDGVAGVSLLTALLRGTPDATVAPPTGWAPPRPGPAGPALVRAELAHRLAALGRGARALVTTRDRATWDRTRAAALGAAGLLRHGLVPASPTPLNARHIGPHRRFDVATLDLGRIKAVKDVLGGTVNDVVLAVVTGALARTLRRHGVAPADVPDFRALVPVNIRPDDARGALGNHVAMLLASLPIDGADPAARYQRVRETTRELKHHAGHTDGAALITRLADATVTGLAGAVFNTAIRLRAFNTVVTNVPGPPFPLWLLGARMQAIYPLVPLFETQGLGVALLSYAGRMFVGLNADWHGLDDLHDLALDLEAELDLLLELAASRRLAPPAEVARA